VVALISIGTGVQQAVLQQFEDIGYDVVLVVPRSGFAAFDPSRTAGFGRTGGQFDPSQIMSRMSASSSSSGVDTDRLLEQVPQLEEAGNLTTRILAVESDAVGGFLRVTSPSASFLEAFSPILGGFVLEQGTGLEDANAREVVIGSRSAESLEVTVGDTVVIGNARFEVVGILAPAAESSQDNPLDALGASQGGAGDAASLLLRGLSNTDDTLFVLEEQASRLGEGSDSYSTTVTRVRTGASVTEAQRAIEAALEEQGTSGTAVSVEEIADSIQGTLGMVETVLASIAAVALIVGAVGLMNTMYTAVLERTREIGVLKAVGARDGQVLLLFVIDSGLMGLIGGVLGLGVGTLFSVFGTRLLGPVLGVAGFAPVFTATLVFGVLLLSFLLGGLAGVWPAWRASRLDPVEALSSE
ncbi:MAG: ABC transporter permease, partial [Candidatus Bipolaricaulota bacterium]